MPSHRVLALLRGRKEGILRLAVVLPDEEGTAGPTEPERRIAARAGIENRGRPADAWLAETVRWTWKFKMLAHLEIEIEQRLRERRRPKRFACSAATCTISCWPRQPGSARRWGSTPGFGPA